MRDWLIRRGGPPSGTPAAAVQEAWLELGHAAKSGDPRRQDAAWDAIWTAAEAADATEVTHALVLVEQSHRGGPLTYEQAFHQLTISVYELNDWQQSVAMFPQRIDDEQ